MCARIETTGPLPGAKGGPSPSVPPSRREWLKAGVGTVLGAGAGLAVRRRARNPDGNERIRPPGARSGEAFLAACIRCGQCVLACPSATLRLATLADGWAASMPFAADLRRRPCTLCREQAALRCIAVCPTDALQPVADLLAIRMGTARIDPATCWAFNRIVCRTCWHACPWPDRALRLDSRLQPVIDAAVCIGCGLCAQACPTEPGSITIEPPANPTAPGAAASA